MANMDEKLGRALDLVSEQWKKEFGDEPMQDGDEFATVFNDGVIILGMENSNVKIQVLLGKPYFVDEDIGLVDEVE